jgi:hypothetical protein
MSNYVRIAAFLEALDVNDDDRARVLRWMRARKPRLPGLLITPDGTVDIFEPST